MTFNSFYNGIVQNAIYGGVAAAIIIFVMFRKANQVAATGNKAKMAGWSVAPAIMIIVAVLAHGVALNVIWPRIQGAFTSAPVQNTLALGNQLTAAADSVLWGSGSGEMMAGYVGADAFKAPVQKASVTTGNDAPLVNNGQTASFVGQSVNIAANERQVMTAQQAVQAVQALAATATPDGQMAAQRFVAQQTGSYTVKRGDSLSKIAATLGVSVKTLCNANRGTISNCNVITAGMVLVVPSGNGETSTVVDTVPASFGQQTATYNTQPTPTPVYAKQPAQQAVAPVRNVSNGQVDITSNASAVQAVQALAPLPTVAPVVTVAPTPRPAYVLAEVLAKPAPGGGQAYIDQFLKTQTDTTVASAGK
jgi:LysM repeat protein